MGLTVAQFDNSRRNSGDQADDIEEIGDEELDSPRGFSPHSSKLDQIVEKLSATLSNKLEGQATQEKSEGEIEPA